MLLFRGPASHRPTGWRCECASHQLLTCGSAKLVSEVSLSVLIGLCSSTACAKSHYKKPASGTQLVVCLSLVLHIFTTRHNHVALA